MRTRSFFLPLVLIAFVAAVPATFACDYVAREFRVGRTFTLSVKDRGTPVEGLSLELRTAPRSTSEKSRVVATKSSDAAGEVRFAGLRAGDYYLTIKHPAVSDQATIHVVINGSRGAVLEWPGNVTVVRSATGGIEMAKSDALAANAGFGVGGVAKAEYIPVGEAKFTLSELMSDKTVASGESDASGKFKIEGATHGTYMLHVQVPPKPGLVNTNFSIPVDLKQAAKAARMTIRLTASCDSYQVVTEDKPGD